MGQQTHILLKFLVLAAAAAAQTPAAFDIEGIKLGMPIKDAMQALRAHNANMRLAPESLTYPGLAMPLTYAINAVGQGEGFYFLVTMPPNEVVVTRATWVTHFTDGNTIPKQDVVVANLAKKYGPISADTGPYAMTIGTRDIYWIDDEAGTRVRAQPSARCLGQSSFYMNALRQGSRNQWDPVRVQLPQVSARLRVEEGYVNRTDPIANDCSQYTMVHARLFRSSVMGVSVPNLVEYVVLMIASGPLDRKATEATHEHWLKTAKSALSTKGKTK